MNATTAMALQARDIMTTKVVVLKPDMPIYDAIDILLRHNISGAPVCEAGRLVGILSEKDCLNLLANGAMYDLPQGSRVRDFMTEAVLTVTPDTDVLTVAELFLKHPYRRMPVLDDGELVGQISRRDVLRGIQRMRRRKPSYPDYRRPLG